MEKTYSFQKLAGYVWDFCLQLGLLKGGEQVALGLSGGRDSRLLLQLAAHWQKEGLLKEVRALHFNHRLREASEVEAKFCAHLCFEMKIPFVADAAEEVGPSEAALKAARTLFFERVLKRGELLLLGHHLDDSLEWSLRQFARTSELKSILGMPAKNARVRRPLLCLSRAQISFACEQFGLEFCEDESNESLHYERNFIRHRLIPPFKALSKSALKNYVARSEVLAANLGVSLRAGAPNFKVEATDALPYTSICLTKGAPLGEEGRPVIAAILARYSSKERGMWRDQVGKLLQAQRKGWAGPLSFSGGVEALVTPQRITLYPAEATSRLKEALRDVDAQQLSTRYPFNSLKYWLFSYCVIDYNDYPVVNRQHILSQWAQLAPGRELITKEQILALPDHKQRLFEVIPLV